MISPSAVRLLLGSNMKCIYGKCASMRLSQWIVDGLGSRLPGTGTSMSIQVMWYAYGTDWLLSMFQFFY